MVEEHGEVRDEELDPEAEARRRLALAQIRQYPDPALRMRARDVESFDDDLLHLVERMTVLMRDANGAGLAATQMGVVRRLFVFQADSESEPQVLINPRIVQRSEEVETAEEGCLSLQGVRVPVERAVRVTVEAQDPMGADVHLELEELGARVVQHEIDHLEGVLILERTTAEARREALAILRPRPLLSALP